jgi:CBS domain-containing protein
MHRHIVPDIVSNQSLTTLAPQTSVREAAKLMTERKIGAIMVVEGGRLVGIFSERDVLGRVVARGLDPDKTLLRDTMTANPVTVGPDDPPAAALEMMAQRGFRHLPVVDGDRIVGMVSIRDLYAAIKGELEEEVHEREAFIFGSNYGVA